MPLCFGVVRDLFDLFPEGTPCLPPTLNASFPYLGSGEVTFTNFGALEAMRCQGEDKIEIHDRVFETKGLELLGETLCRGTVCVFILDFSLS